MGDSLICLKFDFSFLTAWVAHVYLFIHSFMAWLPDTLLTHNADVTCMTGPPLTIAFWGLPKYLVEWEATVSGASIRLWLMWTLVNWDSKYWIYTY